MGTPVFRLRAWRAWAPGRETEAAWRAWATGAGEPAEAGQPTADPVPALLRRRVTPLGQQALRAAWGLPDAATARLIFSSRHGEFARTLSILKGIIAGEGVSPADFTLSVHHALAGLLSIARGNHKGHTAIAAGAESFGFGLMEAVACLAERPDEPVVLVHYDEQLPAPYDAFRDASENPTAVALTLAASGPEEALSLRVMPAVAPPQMAANLAEEFLRFLLSGAAEATVAGERFDWHWGRHEAAP